MKKRLMVFVLAALVVLAVPVMAFADDNGSPKATEEVITSVASDGTPVSFDVTVKGVDDLTVIPTNTVVPAATEFQQGRSDVLATSNFMIWTTDFDAVTKVTLVYTVDPSYAGLTCYVFVEHHDNTVEQKRLEVGPDGKVVYDMTKLSTVTFVLTNEVFSTGTSTSSSTAIVDTNATSPKTGVTL